MRIPFPERVPFNRVVMVAAAFAAIQKFEGTALYFVLGCFAFILLSALAFNAAGGLSRCSGAYVFFYSVLVVLIGIGYKAFLGEPAQTNLIDPVTDIEVYVGGMAAMLAAVIVSRRLTRTEPLLGKILPERRMFRSSIGSMIAGAVLAFGIALLGKSGQQLQSAFAQLNLLIPLGMLLGVIHEIRSSGGTRSANLPIILGGAYSFFLGMVGFSKQGMLTPPFCWLLAVCSQRYRLSLIQVGGCLFSAFVIFHYLVPFSQYGRNLVTEDSTQSQRAQVAFSLLEHPGETRKIYEQSVQEEAQEATDHTGQYYNTPQGFWDRLQFISGDDPLIDLSHRGRLVGLAPVIESFENTVPHFIWPNKPPPKFGGNYYAHELGGLAPDDFTTGISFSPTAEAFHMAGWAGILIVAPLLWILLFITFDSLFGDIREVPWGLLAAAQIAHIAPEGGLTGMIHMLTFGTETFVFCAIFAAYVAPLFAIPVLGPDRGQVMPPSLPNSLISRSTAAP